MYSDMEFSSEKLLLIEQVKKFYEEIGNIDYNFNYLSLLNSTLIDDMWSAFKSKLSNQQIANVYEKLMKQNGFEYIGLGTNQVVFYHPDAPGVVYKCALDNGGIADNINDSWINAQIPEVRSPKVIAQDKSLLITVQEYVYGIKSREEAKLYYYDIIKMCESIKDRYLLIDFNPTMWGNFAIGRNGELRSCDASDLFPIDEITTKPICSTPIGENRKGRIIICGGKLKYNEDYSMMICDKCGRKHLPISLRPKKNRNDETQWIGTGIDKKLWKWLNKRFKRFQEWNRQANVYGMKAVYVENDIYTKYPNYELVPMTNREISEYEKKTGTKIKQLEHGNMFNPVIPEELEDSYSDYPDKYPNWRELDSYTYYNDSKTVGKCENYECSETSEHVKSRKPKRSTDFKSREEQIEYVRSTTSATKFAEHVFGLKDKTRDEKINLIIEYYPETSGIVRQMADKYLGPEITILSDC